MLPELPRCSGRTYHPSPRGVPIVNDGRLPSPPYRDSTRANTSTLTQGDTQCTVSVLGECTTQ